MREIKFRAWDKIKRAWVKWPGKELPDESFVIFGDGQVAKWFSYDAQIPEEDSFGLEITNDYILQQYTGLHDKNGKEIYEGDIIKAIGKISGKDIIREVRWSDEGAAFYTEWIVGWPAVMVGEVIGNIYENPELLKGK